MRQAKRMNAGFTLVELSIVLVIIGLIIGGVLTGKQIMENAAITNALNSIQAYEAQFQTYVQNYNAIAGDDIAASTRFANSGLPSTSTANGDGTLQGTFDSATATDESRLLWAELRAAGLVKGTASNTTQPTNPFNGIFGFQHAAFSAAIASNVLCMNNIAGDAAQAIDSRLDDGNGKTGTIQAMIGTGVVGEAVSGTTVATYSADKTYTMCIRL